MLQAGTSPASDQDDDDDDEAAVSSPDGEAAAADFVEPVDPQEAVEAASAALSEEVRQLFAEPAGREAVEAAASDLVETADDQEAVDIASAELREMIGERDWSGVMRSRALFLHASGFSSPELTSGRNSKN